MSPYFCTSPAMAFNPKSFLSSSMSFFARPSTFPLPVATPNSVRPICSWMSSLNFANLASNLVLPKYFGSVSGSSPLLPSVGSFVSLACRNPTTPNFSRIAPFFIPMSDASCCLAARTATAFLKFSFSVASVNTSAKRSFLVANSSTMLPSLSVVFLNIFSPLSFKRGRPCESNSSTFLKILSPFWSRSMLPCASNSGIFPPSSSSFIEAAMAARKASCFESLFGPAFIYLTLSTAASDISS